MKRFQVVVVNADGSYTYTGNEMDNPNVLLQCPFILYGDAILDTVTGQLVSIEQVQALADEEYNAVDVWTLRKQNAELRALLERIKSFERDTFRLGRKFPRQFSIDFREYGQADQGEYGHLLDALADICQWLDDNKQEN